MEGGKGIQRSNCQGSNLVSRAEELGSLWKGSGVCRGDRSQPQARCTTEEGSGTGCEGALRRGSVLKPWGCDGGICE